MLSASNRLKIVVIPRWKTPYLLYISSLCNSCSYQSSNRRESDFSPKALHMQITSTPVKLPWIRPLYPMLRTCTLKARSLVTQASIEDEELAHQIFDKIISELQKTPNSINELCTNHINKLCKTKNLQTATILLQLLHNKHAINGIDILPSYNLLLNAASENNNTKIAAHIFKHMYVNHLPMNSSTYFYTTKAISKSNDLTFILSFLKEISDLNYTRDVTVFNRIIYGFAECGHVHNAILVFDNIKSLKCKPDLITYNTILWIYGKEGRLDEMLDVFSNMKKTEIPPDIVSYNTVVNSLRKVGRFDLCVVVMKEVGEVGLKFDLRTYTALIECFFRSGNVEESLRLFEEMKRGQIRPSIYVYRSVISNLKRLGKLELAGKLLEEMNECMEDLVGPKDFKRKNR
ncbi:unnamed protein product [Lactuca saligna]|uniref:Pentacotripeptide-repeat region of PRORP domain-containing protein n=1 Tax=Lactuca saligna TaxID=75948 RepID=A0AA35YTW4_LACSI|nr:unnamed protein product [Lactuca saligna]